MQNQNALTTCHSDVPFLFLYKNHSCVLHFIKKCITPESYFGFQLTLNFLLEIGNLDTCTFALFLKIKTGYAFYPVKKYYWSVSCQEFTISENCQFQSHHSFAIHPHGVSVFRSWFDVALISNLSALDAALKEGPFIQEKWLWIFWPWPWQMTPSDDMLDLKFALTGYIF